MSASPISLYIDLEKGQKADLEVIARAAQSFAEALREAAYVLDPSLEVRIELVDGTEGSLSLNSLIKFVKGDVKGQANRLRALSVVAMIWFATHVADKTFDMVFDQAINKTHLTEADRREIAEIVQTALDKQIAKRHVENVYEALQADPVITGVGATTKAGERPANIVPRSEFPERASSGKLLEDSPTKRTRLTTERLVLISPVLKPGNRKWKFAGREGEFSAHVKDVRSLADILAGRHLIPMVGGIELDVSLETFEEKKDGVWQIIDRNIIEIRRVIPPPRQTEMALPPPKPKPPTKRRKNKRGKK